MTVAPTKPLDAGTRLAVDRTRLSYERTLMAWVRTAASLITFGFTIYKFFEFDAGKGSIPAVTSQLLSPRHFGMIMIGTGLVSLAFATIDHRRNLKHMHDEYGSTDHSVSMIVAVIVSGMGLLAFAAVLFRA